MFFNRGLGHQSPNDLRAIHGARDKALDFVRLRRGLAHVRVLFALHEYELKKFGALFCENKGRGDQKGHDERDEFE